MMKDLEDGLWNRSVMSPAACRTKRVLDVMRSEERRVGKEC